MRSGWIVLAVAVLTAAVGCGRGSSEPPVLSSAELQGRWWSWVSAGPDESDPVADQDGSSCARSQPDDVWFLAGTYGESVQRTCTIPGGRPVAFPLVNRYGTSEECLDFMASATGSAALDGKRLDAETYRGESIQIGRFADSSAAGGDSGFSTIGCGLWIQLPPLEPGAHVLKIRGGSDSFRVSVDYALTVDAGQS